MGKTENSRKDVFHAELVKGAKFCGKYEVPVLERTNYIPQRLVSFEKLKGADNGQWVHFYTHDHKFMSIWNNPHRYPPIFRKFEGLILPDFSVYRDMPLALQIESVYRSRALGHWWQRNGLKIIPNVRWGDERTYEFAFDGIQQGGTVAVGSLGGLKNMENRRYFLQGFDEMLKRLCPDTVILYGSEPDLIRLPCLATGTTVIPFDCRLEVSHKKGVA